MDTLSDFPSVQLDTEPRPVDTFRARAGALASETASVQFTPGFRPKQEPQQDFPSETVSVQLGTQTQSSVHHTGRVDLSSETASRQFTSGAQPKPKGKETHLDFPSETVSVQLDTGTFHATGRARAQAALDAPSDFTCLAPSPTPQKKKKVPPKAIAVPNEVVALSVRPPNKPEPTRTLDDFDLDFSRGSTDTSKPSNKPPAGYVSPRRPPAGSSYLDPVPKVETRLTFRPKKPTRVGDTYELDLSDDAHSESAGPDPLHEPPGGFNASEIARRFFGKS
jgi:hypothetical protein